MSLSSWLAFLRPSLPQAAAKRHRGRCRTRLHVEALEDRCLLSSGLSASLVADIDPGAASSAPQQLVNADGTLFFFAMARIAHPEVFGRDWGLWKSDGTTAGTVRLLDQVYHADTPPLDELAAVGGTVFFNSTNGDGFTALWKSDGTSAGTLALKQLGGATNMTPAGDKLFFSAGSDKGNELWVSDGTEQGTKLVKDIYGGTHQVCGPGGSTRRPRWVCYQVPNDSNPGGLTDVNGTLFFAAFDGTAGGLWRSDGTSGGTKLVKHVSVSNPTNVNGTLFFAGYDATTGQELWKSDGTSAGTVLVKDILAGSALASPQNLTNVGGTLYFTADDGAHGRELWKSDGTAAGTALVKDIVPGSAGSVFQSFANVNGTLYFTVDDGVHGAELWQSDGSAAGTALVKDINLGANSSGPSELTNVNGLLYFTADDGTNGRELWQSDGTEAGTVMVQDICAGSTGSNPDSLVAMNNKLYFAATDPEHGRELWDPPPVGNGESYLLVSDYDANSVRRYDAATGAFVDEFVPQHSGGLNQPQGLVFGPHDHNLYVASGEYAPSSDPHTAVLRYDGTTGAFIGRFANSGHLDGPHAAIFGPDGNLYVADGFSFATGDTKPSKIVRYNGRTGAFMDNFVTPDSGGLRGPWALVFGPSGRGPHDLDLYVVSRFTDSVKRYDGTTGAYLGDFVASGSAGLDSPIGLTFGPDGNLYVSAALGPAPSAVFRFQGPSGRAPGAPMPSAGNSGAVFVASGSGGLLTTFGLIFGPDGNGDGQQDLYLPSFKLAGSNKADHRFSTIKRYDGVTGAFIGTFVAANSGGLDQPNYLTFTETDPVTLAYTGGRLTAAAAAADPVNESLGADQAQPLLSEALARWPDTTLDTSSLGTIDIRIANLPGATLGEAVGPTIWLDANAAVWGWFVDPTPWEDSEFTTPGNQGEQHRMDLLTVLAHEVGHLLDQEHAVDGVMTDTLATGIRRMPGSTEVNDWPAIVDVLFSEPLRKRRW